MGDRGIRRTVHEVGAERVEDDEGKGFEGIDLALENEKFDDWGGTCRRCGLQLVGPLAGFREHICAD